jgi:hypothetical protein
MRKVQACGHVTEAHGFCFASDPPKSPALQDDPVARRAISSHAAPVKTISKHMMFSGPKTQPLSTPRYFFHHHLSPVPESTESIPKTRNQNKTTYMKLAHCLIALATISRTKDIAAPSRCRFSIRR